MVLKFVPLPMRGGKPSGIPAHFMLNVEDV